MNEFYKKSRDELKRADHLIFVSLKYTRTVDVLKSIIERLINCVDFCFNALLTDLVEKGELREIPSAPVPKCKLVKELFADDEKVVQMVELFLLWRRISKAEYSKEFEFRRHVALTAFLKDEENVKVNIDVITEYFQKTKLFFGYLSNKFLPQED
ncbi:hypothetical protein HN587_05805 [Candidatus Woesearchaeota archaeon]|jgi:hypothetical protein|nr:hypothetical protein [Candidatus Woesearchaeota archaeon]